MSVDYRLFLPYNAYGKYLCTILLYLFSYSVNPYPANVDNMASSYQC